MMCVFFFLFPFYSWPQNRLLVIANEKYVLYCLTATTFMLFANAHKHTHMCVYYTHTLVHTARQGYTNIQQFYTHIWKIDRFSVLLWKIQNSPCTQPTITLHAEASAMENRWNSRKSKTHKHTSAYEHFILEYSNLLKAI